MALVLNVAVAGGIAPAEEAAAAVAGAAGWKPGCMHTQVLMVAHAFEVQACKRLCQQQLLSPDVCGAACSCVLQAPQLVD